MFTNPAWIITAVALLALAVVCGAWYRSRASQAPRALPRHWNLSPRPIFSTAERRAYRLLRESLPHHAVFCKLPLVRFCQPVEAEELRYWYELLGGIHVGFAICSTNGRILAAIDLETERQPSSRSLKIKQSVLEACRVRYLRCTPDKLPSPAELQLLVPHSNSQSKGPQGPSAAAARAHAAATAPLQGHPARYGGSSMNLWEDSGLFNDSFFTQDSRYDSATGVRSSLMGLDFSMLEQQSEHEHTVPAARHPTDPDSESPHNEVAGVVIDKPLRRPR